MSRDTEHREEPAVYRRDRICVVIPVHWAAFMGGSQFQAKLLIDELAKNRRFDVHYLAHRTASGFVSESHRVTTIRGIPRLRKYTDLFDAWPLYRELRRLRPDLIYQRAASGYTGVAACYAVRNDVPLIWHVASDMEVRPFERAMTLRSLPKLAEKRAIEYGLRHASRIIVQTERQRQLLAEHYGRTDSVLVRNFHAEPADPSEKGRRIRVLWIANLKPIKQPEIFLRLAEELAAQSHIEFVMIGGPSTNHRWQREIDALIRSTPNVRFLGQLSQEAVNAELSRSHLLVNTSKDEGFSNTFIQAWMHGARVVTLNVNPDGVLDDARMGASAGGSFERLVELVRSLSADPGSLETAAEHARTEARRRYSMSNLQELVSVIETTLHSPTVQPYAKTAS